jgi:hypothetical protein
MASLRTIGSGFLCLASLAAAPALAQTVHLAPFDSVELEGGGHVVIRNGKVQQVRIVNGSPAFTRFVTDEPGQLRIEACNRECPRHYDLQIEITTPRLDALAVSGGGEIDGVGSFPASRRLALAIDGGGSIDTRPFAADKVTAAVNGGGLIRLRATRDLTGVIHGGGRIRYRGSPRVTQVIDGGGDIEHAY